jgi:hypothetical protein
MAEVDEEFDFLQGSMKDLAMRMGEIDDVLAEIAGSEETKHEKEKEQEEVEGEEESPVKEDTITILPPVDTSYDDVEDDCDDDVDSDDGGLTDLQGELRQFEEMDKTHQLDAVLGEESTKLVETPVMATVHKPAPTSPLGISMKTSKGITTIVALAESGLLAKTDLRVGHILVKINSIYIKNAKHARYIIQNAAGKVCLESKHTAEA